AVVGERRWGSRRCRGWDRRGGGSRLARRRVGRAARRGLSRLFPGGRHGAARPPASPHRDRAELSRAIAWGRRAAPQAVQAGAGNRGVENAARRARAALRGAAEATPTVTTNRMKGGSV